MATKEDPLTFDGVMAVSVQRTQRWHPAGLNEWSALEWAGAMCGEAGEAANAAKKLKRLDDNLKSINEQGRHYESQDTAKEMVAKECCDTILYALLLLARVGVTSIDPVLRRVFNTKSEEYLFPERL